MFYQSLRRKGAYLSGLVILLVPPAGHAQTAKSVVIGEPPRVAANIPTGAAATVEPTRRSTKRVLVQPLRVTAAVDSHAVGLGEVVASMLETELMKRGVSIVERQQLGALEQEKRIAADTADVRTQQRRGKVKGAAVAVIGTITEFGVREKSAGAAAVLGGIFGARVKDKELRIKIDAHLTNIATSDLIPNSQVAKEASQTDRDWFGGGGTLFRGIPIGGLAGSSANEWLSSKAGKAARKIVEQIADELAAKVPLDSGASGSGGEQEQITLEARGFDGYTAADTFVNLLKALPGVTSAELDAFSDGILQVTITASSTTIKRLPILLETDPTTKPLNLKVSSVNNERVVINKR